MRRKEWKENWDKKKKKVNCERYDYYVNGFLRGCALKVGLKHPLGKIYNETDDGPYWWAAYTFPSNSPKGGSGGFNPPWLEEKNVDQLDEGECHTVAEAKKLVEEGIDYWDSSKDEYYEDSDEEDWLRDAIAHDNNNNN